MARSLIALSIAFSWIRKSNKVWWRGLLSLRQSASQSCVHIKSDSLLQKNKHKRPKFRYYLKVYLVIIHISKSIVLRNYWGTPDEVIKYARRTPRNLTEYIRVQEKESCCCTVYLSYKKTNITSIISYLFLQVKIKRN